MLFFRFLRILSGLVKSLIVISNLVVTWLIVVVCSFHNLFFCIFEGAYDIIFDGLGRLCIKKIYLKYCLGLLEVFI